VTNSDTVELQNPGVTLAFYPLDRGLHAIFEGSELEELTDNLRYNGFE
jgi:hypothetical protein